MSDRLYTAWLFVRCVLRRLVHGPARAIPRCLESVLIVQQGKLGDMVCTTPLFRAIKAAQPDSRVVVLGDKINGLVLAGNGDIDEYISLGTQAAEAIPKLRDLQMQVGIITTPSIRALAMLYLAGVPAIIAPRVIGGRSAESRLYTWLRSVAILVEHRMGQYAPGEYLRMLRPLGIEANDTRKHIAIAPAELERMHALLAEYGAGPFVGISPSAGNRIKQWPPERFAQVADHLYERYGAVPVILGGANDQAEIRAMAQAINPATRLLNLGGRLSIEELKALISQLVAFISVDTGPIYLAEAFGVPTIDITGPIDEREQPPQGEKHLLVTPLERHGPELFVMNSSGYDYLEAKRQVLSISVDQVCAAVDQLFHKIFP